MTNKLTWVDVGKISLRNRENNLYNHQGEKCSFETRVTTMIPDMTPVLVGFMKRTRE